MHRRETHGHDFMITSHKLPSGLKGKEHSSLFSFWFDNLKKRERDLHTFDKTLQQTIGGAKDFTRIKLPKLVVCLSIIETG